MAEYKTTMLIVVLTSRVLISVVKNETFYGKENDHIKIEMESLSTRLRIDFPSKDLVVTNWYSSEVVKGYNVTFNGSIVIFEIMKLTANKQGLYKFGFSIPEEDGIHADHVAKHIHVLIANISCGINYGKDFIGENDCQEKDKVNAWCRIKLPRPTNENLTIEWEIKEMTRNFTDIRHISETDIEAHEVDAPLEVGDTFQCHSKTLKCSTTFEPRNIIYAKNKTTREMFSYRYGTMTPNNKRPVECQANTSASVTCVYDWVHNDGHIIRKFSGKMLLKNDFIKDGLYECYGSCLLRKNKLKPCVLLADRVEFLSVSMSIDSTNQSKNISLTSLAIILFFILLVIISLLIFIYFYHRNDRTQHQPRDHGYESLVGEVASFESHTESSEEWRRRRRNNECESYWILSDSGLSLWDSSDRPQHQLKDYDYESLVREGASFKLNTESSLKSEESLLEELLEKSDRPQHQPKDHDYESLVEEVASFKLRTESSLKPLKLLLKKNLDNRPQHQPKNYDYESLIGEVASPKSHTESLYKLLALVLKELFEKRNKLQFEDHSKEGNLLRGSSCVDLKEKTAESEKLQPPKQANDVCARSIGGGTSTKNQADDDTTEVTDSLSSSTKSGLKKKLRSMLKLKSGKRTLPKLIRGKKDNV